MLVVAGTIVIDPSKAEIATAAFEKMRAATLKEPGCLEYQAYLGRTDPGTLFIFERWENDAALGAHFATPHMAEFGKAMGGFGVKSTDVQKYEVGAVTKLM
jgi:quinol monooxygenase YgiN